MSNLLSDGANWSPGGLWNGTAFEFISTGENDTITYGSPAQSGDVVAFNLTVISLEYAGPGMSLLVNGEVFDTISAPNFDPPSSYTSPALTAGATVGLRIDANSGSYGHELLLTPIADEPPVDPPVEPVISPCDEMGRVTRAYVSGYTRTRVHESWLVRGERRCLVANFNGAIPKARSIASATWRTNQGASAILSNARIIDGGRSAAVDMLAGWGGVALVKVDALLDNGEVYNQVFHIGIQGDHWFPGESAPQPGPTQLTVTV